MSQSERSCRVAVVYGRPDGTVLRLELDVAAGSTLQDAVLASGLLDQVPELRGAALDLGVYNRPSDAQTKVQAGDRIEVYRPLRIDPKDARRRRAELRRLRRS